MKLRNLALIVSVMFLVNSSFAGPPCVFDSGEEEAYSGINEDCAIFVSDGPASPTILTINGAIINGILKVFGDYRNIVNVNGATTEIQGDTQILGNSIAYLNSGSNQNISLQDNAITYHKGGGGGQIETKHNSTLI